MKRVVGQQVEEQLNPVRHADTVPWGVEKHLVLGGVDPRSILSTRCSIFVVPLAPKRTASRGTISPGSSSRAIMAPSASVLSARQQESPIRTSVVRRTDLSGTVGHLAREVECGDSARYDSRRMCSAPPSPVRSPALPRMRGYSRPFSPAAS